MKFRLPFLAFALGTGLALAAPTAAHAQVSLGVNIGLPAWGPAVPQGTQYYYIPEIDGYYDIYNGTYLVFDGTQWITMPYIDGYDPYYFHPVPVSYIGAQPWLYIGSYRSRFPQYVTGYRRGGFGYGGQYNGHEYGAGRVYGYERGGYGGRGYDYNRGRGNVYGGNPGGGFNRSNGGQPFPGGQGNRGGFNPGDHGGGQPATGRGGQGGFGGGQPGGGGQRGGGGQPDGGGQRGGNFGGGQPGGGGGQRGGSPGGGGGQRGGNPGGGGDQRGGRGH